MRPHLKKFGNDTREAGEQPRTAASGDLQKMQKNLNVKKQQQEISNIQAGPLALAFCPQP
jgi:hypothetical protein